MVNNTEIKTSTLNNEMSEDEDINETDVEKLNTSGLGYMDEVGFSKENVQKVLEQEEKKVYQMFQKKLKCWSYCILWFAAYILLNVCIEMSSAPYYDTKLDCYERDLKE